MTKYLEITAWEAPYCYDATPEEKKLRIDREFSEEGIQQGIEWLNELWNAEPDILKNVKTVKRCKIIFRRLSAADQLCTSIFFQQNFRRF